ncbi:MAG: DUF1540 domain-containing protein [Clostridia bacterium]|nr:DUF1540 domain-containing protein [Clostridia bacterium]
MDNKTPNTSIECTVKQCEHHCGSEDYCALNQVRIATHEANPTVSQCVDCESFKVKAGCEGGKCV